jgi:hypothetical protein
MVAAFAGNFGLFRRAGNGMAARAGGWMPKARSRASSTRYAVAHQPL